MVRPARFIRARPQPTAVSLAGGFALAALVVAVPAAWAQRSGLSITPTFRATQEFTDNLNLSATNPRAEAITTLTPGIRISSWTGPLRGSLDFGLSGILYARDSSPNSLTLDNQNDLTASFTFEAVEQHVFIDARASITQQSVSAFGLQADRPNSINSNTTEYRTLTVSPNVRGKLFDGAVDVEGRLTSEYTNSSNENAGSSISHDASVRLSGGRGAFGWSVRGSRSYSDFDGGRATTQDKITPKISYSFDPTFQIFLSGGYERNDVVSLEPTTFKNWGGGFLWQPTPRTRLGMQTEQRYYGRSWSLNFSHRMRRWLVSYTDVNDDNEVTTGGGSPLSNYDLFFAQFAAIEPDPALRDVLVRNFLRSAGLDPNQQATAGFVTSAVTVTRNQNLSLAWRGQRNSAVLSAFATASRRVDEISDAQDDLSQVGRVEQQGVNLSLSHRLSQSAALVMFGSYQRTPSQKGVQGNDLAELSLSWSNRIGPRSSVSVTGRHTRASGANPYNENSLLGTFNYSF